MVAESVYLYMFLVGVFFAVGNVALRGISHIIGGIGGGADSGGAIETDAHAHIGDVSSAGAADMHLETGGDMGFDAGGSAGFDAGGGDVSFDSGGGADFDAGGGVSFEAGGDFSHGAGGDISFDAGGGAGFDTGGGDAHFDFGAGAGAHAVPDFAADAAHGPGGADISGAGGDSVLFPNVGVDIGFDLGTHGGHAGGGAHGVHGSHGAHGLPGSSGSHGLPGFHKFAGDAGAGAGDSHAPHADASHAGAPHADASHTDAPHAGSPHAGAPHADTSLINATADAAMIQSSAAEIRPYRRPRRRFGLLSFLTTWLPLRPTAMICFSTVTGGAGSILLRLGMNNPLAHLFSIASGYVLSMLIGVALPRKLRRSQSTSAAERYELIGLQANVTSAILEGGFGRISYIARDNTYGAPARHIEGRRVPQGARVVICEIKDNVFYVTELNI